MYPAREFSRFASNYSSYHIIQSDVARRLLEGICGHPKKILDLGCGSGEVARLIGWGYELLVAVDIALPMLQMHPRGPGIVTMPADFNTPECFSALRCFDFDLIISSSALQWASDLGWTLAQIGELSSSVALSLFTSQTFATIHSLASLCSPIPSRREILEQLYKHFDGTHQIREYKLFFKSKHEMFRYIKKSGVSGGLRRLSYKETKHLIASYPHDYLEFEVVLFWGCSRTKESCAASFGDRGS